MRMVVPEAFWRPKMVGTRKRALGDHVWRRALLACCGALALPVSVANGRAGIAGVGARPITDTVAATWFIESASPSGEYRMSLMVFLVGPTGWTKKPTDWHWDTQDPAQSTFLVDGHRLHFEYSSHSGRWSAANKKGNVKDANVVVVAGAGTAKPRVVHTEKLRLSVAFDSDPVVEEQSAQLRQILGL